MLAIMKIDKLSRIQKEANELLQGAILSERGQSWNKMAEKYKKLLQLISRSNLPASFVPPSSYNKLLYESFYHFGVALQNLGRHKESVHAYTSAMTSMNLRKNGCMAGCNSNTCFHTPLLAKRAFAYAKAGDIKNAFKDIEKAVMLDSQNPDLYCLRALLWNTRRESYKALDDINCALNLNKSHVGALLIRGSIDQPNQMSLNLLQGFSLSTQKKVHQDHQIAIKLSSEANNFLDVGDIHHPKMIHFWNRFLRCLSIPRTACAVDLMSAVITQYNTTLPMSQDINGPITKSTMATALVENRPRSNRSTTTIDAGSHKERPNSMPLIPFRCGTPFESDEGHLNRSRRLSYGQALRTYTAKRQETGVSEYIQRLVAHASRPNTAKKSPNNGQMPSIVITRTPSPTPPPASRSNSRKSSITGRKSLTAINTPSPPNTLHAPTIYPPLGRRGSTISIASCPIPYNRSRGSQNSGSVKSLAVSIPRNRRASIATVQTSHQEAADFASKTHGIEVFNSVNISGAPRMYYKPWGGDKLPVAELPSRPKLEAFRIKQFRQTCDLGNSNLNHKKDYMQITVQQIKYRRNESLVTCNPKSIISKSTCSDGKNCHRRKVKREGT